jgi:hypothetical protein
VAYSIRPLEHLWYRFEYHSKPGPVQYNVRVRTFEKLIPIQEVMPEVCKNSFRDLILKSNTTNGLIHGNDEADYTGGE